MSDWQLYEPRTIQSIIDELGEVPRPEHPRPDRFRDDWLNLNGVWEFAFDPGDVGLDEKWYERTLESQIIVPFCPESVLSGVYDEELHPVCWYARSFDLPEESIGQRMLLHFGAVDYRADVWLNGKHIGQHVGGYDSFYFDVSRSLKAIGNRLVVRVHDDMSEIKPRGKQSVERYTKDCLYMRVTGIWQTVWLEAVGDTFVRDWIIRADASGKLVVDLSTDGSGNGLDVEAIASFQGEEVVRWKMQVVDGGANSSFTVPRCLPWSPEEPNLYDLRFSLLSRDQIVIDSVDTYFGFRSIEIKDGKVDLNGKPFFMISALDQGYYPDGLYTPPTDDILRQDVEWAKKYGLNHVRKHQVIAEPRFHFWCDVLGLSIWEEMPDWGADILNGSEEYLRQWTACMKRDINHPCIIGWVCSNEQKQPESAEFSEAKVKLYESTKIVDDTRPIIDNSGYCHTVTDITDLHVNPENGEDWKRWWKEWHENIAETGNFPAWPNVPTYCAGYEHKGQPVIISETGNWRVEGIPYLGEWAPYGYGPLANPDEYIALYKDFFLTLMAEPDCAGFSYVQLYDVEGEINGYLTYDRKIRIESEIIASIHSEGMKLRITSK